MSRQERELLKSIKNNNNIVYMWEDKGPSFVKMTKEQYLEAGEKELGNRRFYEEVQVDKSQELKNRNDIMADAMFQNEEISENVAQFLNGGESDLTKYYHLLKTHKIPPLLKTLPSGWRRMGFP